MTKIVFCLIAFALGLSTILLVRFSQAHNETAYAANAPMLTPEPDTFSPDVTPTKSQEPKCAEMKRSDEQLFGKYNPKHIFTVNGGSLDKRWRCKVEPSYPPEAVKAH